jgi:hypothetical protein
MLNNHWMQFTTENYKSIYWCVKLKTTNLSLASCWLYMTTVYATSINIQQIQCETLRRQAGRHKLWFRIRVPSGKTKQKCQLLRTHNLNSWQSLGVLYTDTVPISWHRVQLVFSVQIRPGDDVAWYTGLSGISTTLHTPTVGPIYQEAPSFHIIHPEDRL